MPGPREDERPWSLLRSWSAQRRQPGPGGEGEADDDARLAPDANTHANADAELVECLRKFDFAGPVYEAFTDYMYRYGISVLRGWLRTGKIFSVCREIGIGLPAPPRGWADEEYADDREELAMRTVVRAMNSFRQRALVDGLWKPDGGASLRTFFIGRCKGEFANAYRAWYRAQPATSPGHRFPLPLNERLAERFADPGPDPEAQVLMRDRLREALAGIPNKRTQAAIFLTELGYSQEEIAGILGCRKRAVEGLLRRHRANHPGGGGSDDV